MTDNQTQPKKALSSDLRPFRWLADQVLAWLQKRCEHPGDMVAVDILEGRADLRVSYCNRCGAVKTSRLMGDWRRPDPNLWRGR